MSEKIYAHENVLRMRNCRRKLSKIYFQKTQRKHVCNPNNRDFNRDWMILQTIAYKLLKDSSF